MNDRVTVKICSRCKAEKATTMFHRDMSRPDGLHCYCADCRNEEKRIYWINNKVWLAEKRRAKNLQGARAYYYKNREKILKYHKIYNETHKKEKAKYYQKKRKTNATYRISANMSRCIRKTIHGNKKGRGWQALVGYSLNDLLARLRKTIPKGYKWEDYLGGKTDLHIDHILPIAAFAYTSYTDYDFKRCWALNNLRLLPALDNQTKSSKLLHPFQISLKLKEELCIK